MIPTHLTLRNAKGIEDGLGTDVLTIDFTGFAPGLIALVGPNGCGKTTTMENMQPFLTLPSRGGNLSDHFQGKKAEKYLSFKLNGDEFISQVLIDAETRSLAPYLRRNGQPVEGVNGLVKPYKAAIVDLFGSEELFFRSVFGSQRMTSIMQLDVAERRKLFYELLGFARYEAYAEKAKLYIADEEAKVENKTIKVDVLETNFRGRYELEAALQTMKNERSTLDVDMIEVALKKARQEMQEAYSVLDTQSNIHVQLSEVNERIATEKKESGRFIDDLRQKKTDLGAKVQNSLLTKDRAEKIASRAGLISTKVARMEELEHRIVIHNERRVKVIELEAEMDRIKGAIQEKKIQQRSDLQYAERQLDNLSAKHQREAEQIEREIAELNREIVRLETRKNLMQDVPCKSHEEFPAVCKLLSDARSAASAEAEARECLAELRKKASSKIDITTTVEYRAVQKAKSVTIEEFDPKPFLVRLQNIGYEASMHEPDTNEMESLKGERWRELAAELQRNSVILDQAEKLITEYNQMIKDIEQEIVRKEERTKAIIQELQGKAEVLMSRIDPTARTKYEEIRDQVLRLEGEYKTGTARASELDVLIAQTQEKISEIAKHAQTIGELREEIEAHNRKITSLRLLQKAFSKEGIPALELDAAAPAISAITNELLAGTFGSKFQIRFITTEITQGGKVKETFGINVLDDTGNERNMMLLSGGQQVWIEQAIMEAITLYNQQQNGKMCDTVFRDEKDGALDPDNKQSFLEMLRQSHKLSGRTYTIVITQTPEIWQQIQQRIHFIPNEHRIEYVY